MKAAGRAFSDEPVFNAGNKPGLYGKNKQLKRFQPLEIGGNLQSADQSYQPMYSGDLHRLHLNPELRFGILDFIIMETAERLGLGVINHQFIPT